RCRWSAPVSVWLRRSPSDRFRGWTSGDDGPCEALWNCDGTAYEAVANILGRFLVFRPLQDARRAGAADKFPDRARAYRRVAVADALRAGRAPAHDRGHRAAGGRRVLAPWQYAALSP